MRRLQRTNRVLAVITLILSVLAAVKFGFGYWSDHAIQKEKTVVGTPTLGDNRLSSPKMEVSAFRYYRGQDFLDRPTLVVSYKIANAGTTQALPQYVFDNTVTFVQQTASGTNSILAETTIPEKRLSYLNQNYQENGSILLKGGQSVRVLATYRLESENRPATMMVDGKKRLELKPWEMKVVMAND